MGPTNEVLRQFVGKAVLLGFESLDYWNQSYNRRAVENEVKKLDAAGKRELAEQLVAQAAEDEAKEPAKAGQRPSSCPPPRPRLLVPGLVPFDPTRRRTACGAARRRSSRSTRRPADVATSTAARRRGDRALAGRARGLRRPRCAGAERPPCSARLVGSRPPTAVADIVGWLAAGARPDAGHGRRAVRARRRHRARGDVPRRARLRRRGRRARTARRSSRAGTRRPTCSSRSSRARARDEARAVASGARSPSRDSTSRSTAPRRSRTR